MSPLPEPSTHNLNPDTPHPHVLHSRCWGGDAGVISAVAIGAVLIIFLGFAMIFAAALYLQKHSFILKLTPLAWLTHWTRIRSRAATIDLLDRRRIECNRVTMNREGETVLTLAGPDPSRATAEEQQQRAFHALLLLQLVEDTADAHARPLGPSERNLLVNGQIDGHDGQPLIHPALLQCVAAKLAELKLELTRLRLELYIGGDEEQTRSDVPPAYDERASR